MATAKKTTQAKKPPPGPAARAPNGKLGDLVNLLQRVEGATVADLAAKTGWQPHSVRGALAGALKTRGYVVTSVKTEGVRVYRIAGANR